MAAHLSRLALIRKIASQIAENGSPLSYGKAQEILGTVMMILRKEVEAAPNQVVSVRYDDGVELVIANLDAVIITSRDAVRC